MKRFINPVYVAFAVAATYRVLALCGVVAVLQWTQAAEWVQGAVIMATVWAIALTTDFRRGDR